MLSTKLPATYNNLLVTLNIIRKNHMTLWQVAFIYVLSNGQFYKKMLRNAVRFPQKDNSMWR